MNSHMMSAKVVRFIALTVWLTGEFVLSGCTSAPRAPSSAYPKVYGESPETIRTLGTDHQFFLELTVASLAQRLRGLSTADAFTILALSGGGANGAFGAGALVGLARSGTRPRFSVVTGVGAVHACVSYFTTATNAPARGGCRSSLSTPTSIARLATARSGAGTFRIRPMTISFADLRYAELFALRVPTHRPGHTASGTVTTFACSTPAELLGKQSGGDAVSQL